VIEVPPETEAECATDNDPILRAVGQARVHDSLLLDQLSGLLAAPLGDLDALGHVARLLVPHAADLALIDVLADDGTPQRVAVEYAANPALAALLHESAADLRDDTYATTLVVLRSGAPYLQETCAADGFELFLASARLTQYEQDLLRTLQPCSYLAVPLNWRGRTLGVITLLYTAMSGRRYDGGDQVWTQQLAGRIAAALAIAHLERAAQQAGVQMARLERALEHSQAFERATLEATSAPIVLLDALGRIQRLNPVAEKLLGTQAVRLVGRAFWQLAPPDEIAALRTAFDAIHTDGAPREEGCHWLSSAGSRRYIRWTLTPLLGSDGGVAYVLAVGDLADDIARQAAVGAAADYLSQLHTFMAALDSATTIEDVARTTLAQARAMLGASASVLLRCSANGVSLETIAAVGYPEGLRVPLSLPVPLVTAVRTGEPVVLQSPEEAHQAGYDGLAYQVQPGAGALAAIPLKTHGRVIGALELSFIGTHIFGADDLAFLRVLAAQCAWAIEHVQLCASQDQQLDSARSLAHLTPLSSREHEVLELLVQGLSHPDIATRLGVGTATVKTHIDHLCAKLDISGSARSRSLATRALLLGLARQEGESPTPASQLGYRRRPNPPDSRIDRLANSRWTQAPD
jgi:PAS domain S-box-containing protein